ncbi:hypothetical protein B0A49_11268 [Cryomyces minteri]|uniref:Ketosynthase family 3 (KS3) domain-containing protein n=1 Tax=Cryomyces minteri TaxID=331657 RepID=A0A4U0WFB4_9PEZI|nr:hypothetical protein B0A49_11268 [Cryomyces minteri]
MERRSVVDLEDGPTVIVHKGWCRMKNSNPVKSPEERQLSIGGQGTHDEVRRVPKLNFEFVNDTNPSCSRNPAVRKLVRAHVMRHVTIGKKRQQRLKARDEAEAISRVSNSQDEEPNFGQALAELRASHEAGSVLQARFNSFPMDMQPHSRKLLARYLAIVPNSTKAFGARHEPHPFRAEWFRFAMTDKMLSHAFLYASAVCLGLIDGSTDSNEAMKEMDQTLRLVNQRLNESTGLDRGHFLSRTGNCKTFDESADGYCRGEAVQALIDNVLAEAGVDATSISYVEMHGTGTQARDVAETASVLESLAAVSKRKPQHSLHIGAAKSNVGHGEAAAGVTSLAKVMLMLKHPQIPPHCGIKTKINSKIPDLKARETYIAQSAVSWPRPSNGVRRVLLNNFSAAGGNTALVLEDPPEIEYASNDDARMHHVVAVSAKTVTSLGQNLKNMIAWINSQAAVSLTLPRLSYTSTARRIHYPHRVAVTGTDLKQISASLQASLELGDGANSHKGISRCVFSFTGQGSHYASMGADLYSRFSSFRSDIQRHDQLCLSFGFPPICRMFEDASAYDEATNPDMM